MTPEEIKAIREVFGWTQADLAREMGVSTNAISRWEQGNRRPRGAAETLLLQIQRRARRAEGKDEAA